MAGIGTVMFGKALVLAAWGGITTLYAGWKVRRGRAGIALRYDRKRDLHYDPVERWEARGKKTCSTLMTAWMWIVAAIWSIIGILWLVRS